MRIVLDTNIYQEDFPMNSGRFRVLLEYAERTGATFVLPRIIHDEVAANYRREVKKRLSAVIRAHEQLHGIDGRVQVPRVEVDPEEAADHYMSSLRKRLNITPATLTEYKPEYLADALKRAIDRKRPCSDRGEEIRDAVLWLSVLDAATESGEAVFFISRNTDQFSADKQTLHPDLLAEATARSVNVEYLPSLEEFARQHASKIAFITTEWLEEHLDVDLVLDAAYDQIMETAYETARAQLGWRDEIEGGFRIAGGGIDVDEFFVNVLADGQLRVEINWWGRIDVEYKVSGDGDDLFDHWTGRSTYATRTRKVEVRVGITSEATIKGEEVVESNVVKSWAERY